MWGGGGGGLSLQLLNLSTPVYDVGRNLMMLRCFNINSLPASDIFDIC